MKKILYATTAIAAVSAISAANAQESAMMSAAGNDLSIGGYYEFGYASRSDDVDSENDAADSFTYGDSELYIDFETTSDAGLTYGVQLDFEVVNGASHAESGPAKNAEESSIYVSGNFGTIHLGHANYASDLFNVWAPTHEGAFSQYDSINGIRYGYTAQVIGDNATAGEIPRRVLMDPDNSSSAMIPNPAITTYTRISQDFGEGGRNANDEVQALVTVFETNDDDITDAGQALLQQTADNTTGRNTLAADIVSGSDGTIDTATAQALIDRGISGDGVKLAYTASWTQGTDDAKITYVSPNLGGLSFGASFADSDSSENSPTSFGGSFTGSVDRIPFVGGGFSYKLAAWQYGNGGDGLEETSTTHLGVNIGIADLTLTAAQLEGDVSTRNDYELKTLEFGIGYAVHDALSVGFSTADAENDADEEGSFQSVSLSYTIAPGLKTTAAYNQYEVEDNLLQVSNDGTELVWQVEFAF